MFFKRLLSNTSQKGFLILVSIFLIVLVNGQSITTKVPSAAQQTPPNETRKILIHRSTKMPEKNAVAVTAIKNLQGDRFLRDLEIEIQNNFSKPIYHMEIDLELSDVVSTELDGIPRTLTIPLIFGKKPFLDPGEKAEPTDKAIQPGEKYIFRIPEAHGRVIEEDLVKKNIAPSAITKIRLRIYEVNFGDGTGFEMEEPFSDKQSLNQVSPKKLVKASFRKEQSTF